MSGLGETTCRGAPVAASGRVLRARSRGASGRIAASVVLRTRTTARAGSVVRRYAVVGASCGNTGSSPGFFQPGHGDSVATPLTRGRGDEGPVGDGSGGARHRGVVRGTITVGRNTSSTPEGACSGAVELRLRLSVRATPPGAPAANADAHGVAPLSGRAPGRARSERRRSTGLRVPRSPA